MTMRFKREPDGFVPRAVVAHFMGFATVREFEAKLPELLLQGFPSPNRATGTFYMEAIRTWARSCHPQQFPSDRLIASPTARDAKDVVRQRLTRVSGG
jgi:hypothetical protein